MIRVGVLGATGKMGREVCRAVHADPELSLVAAVSRSAAGGRLDEVVGLVDCDVVAHGDLSGLAEARVDVAIDFTGPAYAREHVAYCIAHGMHAVVGTTGFEIDAAWGDQRAVGLSGYYVEPDGQPRPRRHGFHGHQDPGHEGGAIGSRVADPKRLAEAAEEHVLIGHDPGQAD